MAGKLTTETKAQRARQRMIGLLLDGDSNGEKLVFRSAVDRNDVRELGPTLGERSGLVKRNHANESQ